MHALRRFFLRLACFLRPTRAERDLERELASHLRLLQEDFQRRGLTSEEARQAARRAFGSVASVNDSQRDTRSLRWLEDARGDLRYACRVLRRNPGFAAAAVATLALGTGASTAIFSVAYGVSLRPLPYPQPERLIRIYEANPANGQLEHEVSVGALHAWREGAPSIESAALFKKPGTRFLAGAERRPVTTMSVSPSLFDVLGVRPVRGDGFKPESQYTRFNADDDGMLSFGAWQRLFGGRSDVIGKQIEVEGVGENDFFRIVGVMPESFTFAEPVDLWRAAAIVELPIHRLDRSWRYDRAVARLRPGATVDQARAELVAVSARLAREFPSSNGGWTASAETLHESIVGNFGRATWLLVSAVALVLLVACLNVGSLLMARGIAREREAAVRVALGAGSWRLARLWLSEASLLTLSGAALGALLASWGIHALKSAAPPGIPRLDAITLDVGVVAAAAAAAPLAVVILTIAPIDIGRRRDLASALRTGSMGGTSPRSTARSLLTVAQCAGAATLVVLAVMLSRSFVKLSAVDLGWKPSSVLSLRIAPPVLGQLRQPWALYVDWSDTLIERLEATPGIRRAAITTHVPLSPQSFPGILARGRADSDARWPCVHHHISDGYFDVMGMRLLSGRTFGPEDRFTSAQLLDRPEHGTAIVSESTARTLWPGVSPIGQALSLPNIGDVKWRKVVGVVADTQFYAVGEQPVLQVFVPWTQFPTGNPRLVVKGTGDAASMATLVSDVVRAVAAGTAIYQIEPLDALVSRATAQPRFTSRTVALFGALALLLAAVGIYGTLSYIVRAGAREIGIRLALGASRTDILSQTLWRGLVPTIVGGIIGLAIAIALGRLFRGLLFGLSPFDVSSLATGAILLLVIAAGAALGPARRAARIDPAATLRTD